MTKFTDGPAAGCCLNLGRSPVFLRVVEHDGKFDALDQLDDMPGDHESITVYRKVSDDGTVHIDGRDKKGKRFGAWYQCATYAIYGNQPEDKTARTPALWMSWCKAEYERGKGA